MLKHFRDRKTIGRYVGLFLLMLVIAAFILLYVPDFLSNPNTISSNRDVAWVDGSPITSRDFLQGFRIQDAQYRQQLGNQYSPELLRQLGLDNFVIQQLIQEKVLTLEAERLGIFVSDEEVSSNIQQDPSLQRDGIFIGKDAYLALFTGTGMTPTMYEEQVRQQLLREKLQNLVTDGVIVNDAEVEEEYRKRNETAHLQYAVIQIEDSTNDFTPNEEAIRTYYNENPKEFQRPTQRKARFITITPQLFTSAVTTTEREIERYYEENISNYSTREQVQASHILFKTDDANANEQDILKKAQSVHRQIQDGADFGELAKTYSEDTSSERGGDLGMFGRGAMVPEFEEAAFALQIGETSEIVRSTYGFHIIKVTDKQSATTQPLENVKDQIRGTLTQEKARNRMEEAIESATQKLQSSQAIDALTADYPLLVPQDTPFFARGEPLPQLSNVMAASQTAFETDINSVTPAIPLGPGAGYAFLQVLEERPAGIEPFDTVEAKVTEKLRTIEARKQALAQALEIREQLVTRGPERAGITLQTNENFFRGTQLSEAGQSAAVKIRAFEIPQNQFSQPLESEKGYVIIRVIETSGFDNNSFLEQKDTFEEQVLNENRNRIWGSFVSNLQSSYKVRIDWQAIRSIVG